MASLADLEVQESNNFITAVIHNGETPELQQMREALDQARDQGSEGQGKVDEFLNQTTPAGACLKRLTELESDIRSAMHQVGLTPELAYQANQIFQDNPVSLTTLSDQNRQVITTYWIKKKSCIEKLTNQNDYTIEELFSPTCYLPNNTK